jgi:hypothetical protein
MRTEGMIEVTCEFCQTVGRVGRGLGGRAGVEGRPCHACASPLSCRLPSYPGVRPNRSNPTRSNPIRSMPLRRPPTPTPPRVHTLLCNASSTHAPLRPHAHDCTLGHVRSQKYQFTDAEVLATP